MHACPKLLSVLAIITVMSHLAKMNKHNFKYIQLYITDFHTKT